MTQTPEPNYEATTPVVPTTPEPPTVAFRASAAMPPGQPAPYTAPTTSYAAPNAPAPSPYAAPTAPAPSPYAASSAPAPSPYTASSAPGTPYGAPTSPNATPTSPYGAPATPSPYTAPTGPHTAPTASHTAPTAPHTAPTAPYTAPTASYTAPTAPYTAPTAQYATQSAPAAAQPYGAPTADGAAPATPYAVPPVPPVSGQPAYGHPYADQPLSGPPYGVPPAAARKARRTAVIVLSIVTVLLFVVGGLFGGLFVAQRGETDRANAAIAAQNADLTAKAKKIEELQANLDSVNSANILQQQELDGSKNDRDEQERQKKVIGKCLDLLLEAFAADTESEFDKKIRGAEKTCDEADSYM